MSVDIEMASTEEILVELFSRTTFAGIVIYSPQTHKFSGQSHKQFLLRTSCDEPGALFLLKKGVEALANNTEGDKT